MSLAIFCLMGPTGSGKTQLAVELVQRFPFEIISVDSAMVYRGMDIGTAKPSAEILKIAPHRLINICDPCEVYSAAQFRVDALREINAIHTQQKIPLLVGGTMLYFRALQQGLAECPSADHVVRAEILREAEQFGWLALHERLTHVDPEIAMRIHPHDTQRIQRALEVYVLTGKKLSSWQTAQPHYFSENKIYNFALAPMDRGVLHARIATRFKKMLAAGLIDEVQQLYQREDLSLDKPALRAVGYRQVWQYLAGLLSYDHMEEKSVIATRQLAKRQLTWLRHWPELTWFNSEAENLIEQVKKWVNEIEMKCK